ncbi:MAG: ROK family protein [Actinobacteria bacterium]|nr:ROK family protein [Actinomycetota bacterium]
MYYLAVDLGGTKTLVGIFESDAKLINKVKFLTAPEKGFKDWFLRINETVHSLLATTKIKFEDLRSIGVAAPGLVDSKNGVMEFSPNFPGWINVSIKDILERNMGVRTIVDHDVRAMVLGEKYYGAAKKKDNFVCITIGTGIGLGIFANGKVYAGDKMRAGELGHITIDEEGPLCGCGNHGCLEAIASGPAIASQATACLNRGEPSVLQNLIDIEAKDVLAAAENGDPVAVRIISKAGQIIGLAIANLVTILDPSLVILSGGVVESSTMILEIIRHTVRERSYTYRDRTCNIIKSPLGEEAVLYGALRLCQSIKNAQL